MYQGVPYSTLPWIGLSIVCFYSAKLSLFMMSSLYSHVLSFFGLNVKWKEMGAWAVITGGTDGIGKAYAQELAQRGFHIVLISRTPEKLSIVAENIKKLYGVQTKTVAVDFTDTPEIYKKIENETDGLEIGVLVNNVGMSYEHAEYFHKVTDGERVFESLIRANIVSCTMMMRMILPQMERRRKGVVINISSLTALYPMPLLSVYAACKAYVDYLTKAVQVEYKDKGIIIQSVLPAFVATKMSKIKKPSLLIPSAETYVHNAMKTVGTECCTYGYLPHKIRGYIHEVLRETMPTPVNMAIAFREMTKIRNRYYKKREQNVK